MERYSIFETGAAAPAPDPAPSAARKSPDPSVSNPAEPDQPVVSAARKILFPGEDGGKSLNEMAQRDLDATLQLLAERAQYITGATGAAIALRSGEEIVCRASAGSSAPELGAHLQVETGLSGESIRTKQILRCNDAQTDPRVNRESCEALGIASVVVMPLVHEGEVNGVFELLSDRTFAFEERDIGALERLGEMVQTALEHALAAQAAAGVGSVSTAVEAGDAGTLAATLETVGEVGQRVPQDAQPVALFDPNASRVDDEPILLELETAAQASVFLGSAQTQATEAPKKGAEVLVNDGNVVATPVVAPAAVSPEAKPLLETADSTKTSESPAKMEAAATVLSLKKCVLCGFPVSEGRTLCLDCEKKQKASGAPTAAAPRESAAPLFSMGAGNEGGEEKQSWLSQHRVLVSVIAVVVLILLALLVLR